MRQLIRPQRELCLLTIFLFGFFPGLTCYAQSNDAYLDALEGEASNITVDRKTTKVSPNSFIAPAPTVDLDTEVLEVKKHTIQGGLPLRLSYDNFVSELKSNYFGTYHFFKRLRDDEKQEVYFFYQSNNDPDKIRDQVRIISKRK